MHFNIALAASIVSAVSVVSAKQLADRSDSLGSLLGQRNVDTFFDESTSHDTPRHARPVFQSASSSGSAHKKQHKRHSKRGTCKKKDSSSSSSSGETKDKSADAWSTLALDRPASTPSSSSSAAQAKETGSNDSKSKDNTVSPVTSGKDVLGGTGLFSFVDATCGKSGATEEVTKTSGPNGAMDWLNCGINAGGWTPPDVKMKDILVMSLDEALEEDNSPFKACQPYLSIFDKYAAEYDIPAIMIASIAMQESTCNKDASGDNGGAHGLMQITSDKCTSGISCSDPDYNVKTGTKYLRDRLDANDGNILLALGQYNGWYRELTVAKATAIKDSCCQCQNNINYHMQMLNGWLLNKNGYELGDWNMGC